MPLYCIAILFALVGEIIGLIGVNIISHAGSDGFGRWIMGGLVEVIAAGVLCAAISILIWRDKR